jgi:hypothetical protein
VPGGEAQVTFCGLQVASGIDVDDLVSSRHLASVGGEYRRHEPFLLQSQIGPIAVFVDAICRLLRQTASGSPMPNVSLHLGRKQNMNT